MLLKSMNGTEVRTDMSQIHSSSPKKHSFNIIDFILITAVIACIIGIAIRYNLGASLTKETDTAVITVRISSLLKENEQHLVTGDVFRYQTTNEVLGTLLSKEIKAATINYALDNGTFLVLEDEERVNVFCKIEVKGYQTENGFMDGGDTYIGCGKSILVYSNHIETAFLVTDIVIQK